MSNEEGHWAGRSVAREPNAPRFQLFVLFIALLFIGRADAAQFVEIIAEIKMDGWSYWFRDDRNGWSARRGVEPTTVFTTSAPIRCVVGTNMWLMENDFIILNSRVTRWFTGSNLVERTLVTQALSEEEMKRRRQAGLDILIPHVGHQHTEIQETADGNPGRPVRVADLLMDASGMMTWLVFCSGPALKREGRWIPPPSAFWKQSFRGDFTDKTVCFEDSLGLPRSIDLFTKQGQLVMQYQVRQSTNLLGWNFPLEFYLVQYARGPDTNSFQLDLTAKGRVKTIRATTEPRLPDEND